MMPQTQRVRLKHIVPKKTTGKFCLQLHSFIQLLSPKEIGGQSHLHQTLRKRELPITNHTKKPWANDRDFYGKIRTSNPFFPLRSSRDRMRIHSALWTTGKLMRYLTRVQKMRWIVRVASSPWTEEGHLEAGQAKAEPRKRDLHAWKWSGRAGRVLGRMNPMNLLTEEREHGDLDLHQCWTLP